MSLKAFEFQQWHIWQGTADILVSDQTSDELRYFRTVDDVVNWLYLEGHKEAARAFNAHAKG